MRVPLDLQGRNVRCPHCRSVVRAPVQQPGDGFLELQLPPPPVESPESIFGEEEHEVAPHLVQRRRFVLPYRGRLRPAWAVRLGLFLYDRLGRNSTLEGSTRIRFADSPYGAPLQGRLRSCFVYSDCTADDSRLVILNAKDAAERGADVRVRHRLLRASRQGAGWRAEIRDELTGETQVEHARALVNAAGPWVEQVITRVAGATAPAHARLVKGGHIVVPRVHDAPHAMILQNGDGRVVFVIPYEGGFSLIGTTDIPCEHGPQPVEISAGEIDYLCAAVNRYLARPVGRADVVWSYAGVRPLYDDGETDPSAVTRDYVLTLDAPAGAAPLLSVFGGKITTARKLAEHAMEKLAGAGVRVGAAWTGTAPLPGGEMESFAAFLAELRREFPALDPGWLAGLARRHGTRARAVLDGARSAEDLGRSFGGGLYGREVEWFRQKEWADAPDDILWRRTKCGLHMTAAERAAFAAYMASSRSG